jgi:hypothetical protein
LFIAWSKTELSAGAAKPQSTTTRAAVIRVMSTQSVISKQQ